MTITIETLRQIDDASLHQYVRNRVYKVEPADPPVSVFTRNPEHYCEFLVLSLDKARREKHPLATRIAFATVNIFSDIKEQIDQGDRIDQHDVAIHNLAWVILHSGEELHQIPNGLTVIQRVTDELIREQPILRSSWLVFNALAAIQREGDKTYEFWQEWWAKKDRPGLWGLSYRGLARSNLAVALSELPRLVERLPLENSSGDFQTRWDPWGAIWSLYTAAKKQPKSFENLVLSFKTLNEQDRVSFINMLEQAGAEKDHLELLKGK